MSDTPRPRRRSLRLVALALAVLLVGPLGVWYAASPGPDRIPASLGEEEIRASTESPGPGQPAQELAAVLDILYRSPAPGRPEAPPVPPEGAAPATASPPAPPTASPPASATTSASATANPEKIRAAQERLTEIGYLHAPAGDSWTPEALQALREFRSAQGLASDSILDEATEKVLYDTEHLESAPFVGVWAPDLAACAPRHRTRFLTAVINHKGAWAGDVSCSFAEPRREGDTWSFAAVCSRGRNRWTSNVRLTPSSDSLTWTSERGAQRYLRCPGGEPRSQR